MKLILKTSLVLAALFFAANSAQAATSADATIFNRATLSYDGGADVTVGVGVKVGLVGAAPTLNAPGDDSVVSGNVAIFTYTIFSNATGSDTYNLTANSVDSGVNAPGTIIFKDAGAVTVTSIVLGASISGGTNTAGNTVLIPAGSEVNLSVGMDVRLPAVGGFAGGLYNIDSITAGTVKTVNVDEVLTVLNLSPLSGSPAIAIGDIPAGTPIGEEKTFTMEVPTGTLTAPPTSGTHTVTLTATGVTVPPSAPFVTTDEVIVTVTTILVTMTKSVAIVDTGGAACTATNGTVGAFVFFPTVLDADSGACVAYRITVAPAAAQPALTTAIVTDAVPEHTIYVTDSLLLNTVQISTISGTDSGTLPLAAGTFQVNSPNSGANSGTGRDGTGDLGVVDAGATAELIFRAVISD